MLVSFSTTLAKEQFTELICLNGNPQFALWLRQDWEYGKSHARTRTHTRAHTHSQAYLSLPYTNIRGHNAPGLSLPTVAVTHCRS